MEPGEQFDEIILEGDEAAATPLVEEATISVIPPQRRQTDGQVKTPKTRGAIQENGRVRVAVMRPCLSRGKRLRGLPPIYEAAMLARNAKVMEGWPMFVGHLAPEILAKIQAVGRSPADLGGRVAESWFDPELRLQEDDDHGYRPGAIVGEAIPYKLAEDILSRDPEGLHNSINAYPTSARSGTPSWDKTKRGMVIEGIRRTPVGSVDWVVRGGAGGRPYIPGKLSEHERRVVSILESVYGAAEMEPDLTTMSAEQLVEWMQEHRSELVPVLTESLSKANGGTGSGGKPQGGALTESRVIEIVTNAVQESKGGDGDDDDKITEEQIEERVQEVISEREGLREREKTASGLISEAVREKLLTRKWADELSRRYALLPSGPQPALLCEAEIENGIQTKTADEVLESRVKADIEHAVEMIREAQAGPVVRQQGGGGSDPSSGGSGSSDEPQSDVLTEFIVDTGLEVKEGEKPEKAALEAIAENLTNV